MTTIENRTLAADAAEKLLTVDGLCEYLVVSKDFVYDEVRHGRLRASRIARPLRFRPADVDAFHRGQRRHRLRRVITFIRAGRRGRTPAAAAAGGGW